MRYFKFIILLFFLVPSKKSFAQTCGTSPAGVNIGTIHPKGTWMISYKYMNMMMEDNLSGTSKISDDAVLVNYIMSPQKMRMDMHMLMLMYGVSDKITLMAMSNYNVLNMDMNMLPDAMGVMHMDNGVMTMTGNTGSTMSSKIKGIGDTKLTALYTLTGKNGHFFILSAGINLPTGSTHLKGDTSNIMYPGTRLPMMMQMGSGTFDLMPGATYILKKEKISLSAQILPVMRPFYNSIGYHLGNELTGNAWFAYQWLSWMSTSARIESFTSGAVKGNDPQVYSVMEPASNPVNYGGQRISGFAGINFFFKKGVLRDSKFSFEYGIPFYQKVNGIQLATRSNLIAGLTLMF